MLLERRPQDHRDLRKLDNALDPHGRPLSCRGTRDDVVQTREVRLRPIDEVGEWFRPRARAGFAKATEVVEELLEVMMERVEDVVLNCVNELGEARWVSARREEGDLVPLGGFAKGSVGGDGGDGRSAGSGRGSRLEVRDSSLGGNDVFASDDEGDVVAEDVSDRTLFESGAAQSTRASFRTSPRLSTSPLFVRLGVDVVVLYNVY